MAPSGPGGKRCRRCALQSDVMWTTLPPGASISPEVVMNKHFDAIVIGAGQAGPSLAGRLSDAGKTVALIERKLFGGTCVNTGCMPTKAMVASAYAIHTARRGAEYGMTTGPVSVDFGRVMARKEKVRLDARSGVEKWLKGMKNCTVFEGHARFEGPREVRIGDELISGSGSSSMWGPRRSCRSARRERRPLSHQQFDHGPCRAAGTSRRGGRQLYRA